MSNIEIAGELVDTWHLGVIDNVELVAQRFTAPSSTGARSDTFAVIGEGLAISWAIRFHADILEPVALTTHSALLPTRWTEVRNDDPCRLIGIPCFQHDDPVGALCPPTDSVDSVLQFLGGYWHYKHHAMRQRLEAAA